MKYKSKRTKRLNKSCRVYEVKMGKYLYYVHIHNIVLPISKMLSFRDGIRNGFFLSVSLDYYSAWQYMQKLNSKIEVF